MRYTLTMPRTGRPRKPEEEKYVARNIKFPPSLWAQLEEAVPDRQRAQFIRDAIEKALRSLKRKGGSE